jgi:succinate-semialdehyde dehydrogenase/glutarate-semialdehyde dehydrogenase
MGGQDREQEVKVVESVEKRLFIGGEWVDAADGGTFEVIDPATGGALCAVADATPADGTAALESAVAAQSAFAATSPRNRADMLTGAFELMHERIDDLALLMTLEMGKPLAEARGEIAYAAEFFRHFAGEAERIDGGYQTAPAGGARFLVARQPVGPCLLITPWNFPMAMGSRKIGPAIAAGCTSVVKPAHQTPLSMFALMNILTEAGVPAGVVNCVTAMDAGGVMEPLIRSGLARKLSFTGSTRVAGFCSNSARRRSCGRHASSAATRRSSCSRTQTSTRRWPARSRRRCGTWVRPAPRPTGCTCIRR